MRRWRTQHVGLPFGVVGNGTGGVPALTFAQEVQADNPAAWWRLGEAVGLVAADEVGVLDGAYSAAGVTYGQPSLVGDANTSVILDGVSGEIIVPDDVILDLGNGPFSYELGGAQRADAAAGLQLLYCKKSQGNTYFNGNKFSFDNDGAVMVEEAGTTIDTGTKHHWVVTYAGSGAGNILIYKDGVDVTSNGPGVGNACASNAVILRIGSYTGGIAFFNGTIDEVVVYNTVLSPARVLAHFNAI